VLLLRRLCLILNLRLGLFSFAHTHYSERVVANMDAIIAEIFVQLRQSLPVLGPVLAMQAEGCFAFGTLPSASIAMLSEPVCCRGPEGVDDKVHLGNHELTQSQK
jgi:hypothetical protein